MKKIIVILLAAVLIIFAVASAIGGSVRPKCADGMTGRVKVETGSEVFTFLTLVRDDNAYRYRSEHGESIWMEPGEYMVYGEGRQYLGHIEIQSEIICEVKRPPRKPGMELDGWRW
jgi:hypothetical protein